MAEAVKGKGARNENSFANSNLHVSATIYLTFSIICFRSLTMPL